MFLVFKFGVLYALGCQFQVNHVFFFLWEGDIFPCLWGFKGHLYCFCDADTGDVFFLNINRSYRLMYLSVCLSIYIYCIND